MRKKYIVMEPPFQGYELIICIESRFSKKLMLELIYVPVRTPDISNTTHIFFLPDFAKIDTICSFSFLRLSQQPVIRFE